MADMNKVRMFQAGDVVEALDQGEDITPGRHYVVLHASSHGSISFLDDAGDRRVRPGGRYALVQRPGVDHMIVVSVVESGDPEEYPETTPIFTATNAERARAKAREWAAQQFEEIDHKGFERTLRYIGELTDTHFFKGVRLPDDRWLWFHRVPHVT